MGIFKFSSEPRSEPSASVYKYSVELLSLNANWLITKLWPRYFVELNCDCSIGKFAADGSNKCNDIFFDGRDGLGKKLSYRSHVWNAV